MRRSLFLSALLVTLTLAGCGGPVDPDRPPLYDYEFDPIHNEGDVFKEPSRI